MATDAGHDFENVRLDEVSILAEFDDPERKKLIAKIVEQNPELVEIPRCSVFALWFSDMTRLREFASWSDPESECYLHLASFVDSVPELDVAGIASGRRQLPRYEKDSILGKREREDTSEEPSKRLAAVKKVLARDNNQCVVTKHGKLTLQIAHIMPFKLDGRRRDSLWRWLQFFWGRDKVKEWQRQILGDKHIIRPEHVYNMLTILPQIHMYWDEPVCAFRPIRVNDEQTSMEIAFHWLPLPNTKLKRTSRLPLQTNPYPDLLPTLQESPGDNIFVFHMNTKCIIRSGTIFTITTDDPIEKPLPSFELLELQWHLGRVAAMQGAAEEDDDEGDDNDDDDSVAVLSRAASNESLCCDPVLRQRPKRSLSRSRSRSSSRSRGLLLLPENIRPRRSISHSRSPSVKSYDLPEISEVPDDVPY